MIEVKQIDERTWGFFINSYEIGRSKARSDCDFHKNILDVVLVQEYNRGFRDGRQFDDY